MQFTLALSGLLLGLAAAPHCAGMCAVPCAAALRATGRPATWGQPRLQLGRIASYAAAGALAAGLVDALAWSVRHGELLRLTLLAFHATVLFWGASLLLLARQPAWLSDAGQRAFERLKPLAQARGGLFGLGLLWALMPCGMLYTALLLASLQDSLAGGALTMALFALGSSPGLLLGPWLWRQLVRRGKRWSEAIAPRLAGALLVSVSGWAIWMQTEERIRAWCS